MYTQRTKSHCSFELKQELNERLAEVLWDKLIPTELTVQSIYTLVCSSYVDKTQGHHSTLQYIGWSLSRIDNVPGDFVNLKNHDAHGLLRQPWVMSLLHGPRPCSTIYPVLGHSLGHLLCPVKLLPATGLVSMVIYWSCRNTNITSLATPSAKVENDILQWTRTLCIYGGWRHLAKKISVTATKYFGLIVERKEFYFMISWL